MLTVVKTEGFVLSDCPLPGATSAPGAASLGRLVLVFVCLLVVGLVQTGQLRLVVLLLLVVASLLLFFLILMK